MRTVLMIFAFMHTNAHQEMNTHSCDSVTMRDKMGPWLYDSALTLYSELVAKSVLAEMNKKTKII